MNTTPNDALRAELTAAIAAVRRQIEIQSMSDHYVGSGRITQDAIAELTTELAGLEAALARLP